MSDVKLYHGDCLEVMGGVADKSVDLILTDPPYGTTACKWDSVIPFDKMWEQLNRIIKDNGAIILFGQEPFSSALRMSNIKNYKYDWIWKKNKVGNIFNCKHSPLKEYEVISVFSKYNIANGSKNMMKYFPQGLENTNIIYSSGNRKTQGTITNRPCRNKSHTQTQTNYPRNILEFNCENGLHPTQKPTDLLEYLIKTYTLENETVLDFTMGSGSTGVACVNTNRNFIGIEKDDNYFKIAKERIEKSKESIFDI